MSDRQTTAINAQGDEAVIDRPRFYADALRGTNGRHWCVRDKLDHGRAIAKFVCDDAPVNKYAAHRHADWWNGKFADPEHCPECGTRLRSPKVGDAR